MYSTQNVVFALSLLPLRAAWVTQRQSFTRFYCQSKREHNRFAAASLRLAFLECLAASDSPCLFCLELLTSSHSFQVSHLACRDLGAVCEQFFMLGTFQTCSCVYREAAADEGNEASHFSLLFCSTSSLLFSSFRLLNSGDYTTVRTWRC